MLEKTKQPLILEELTIPPLKEGQVLVEICYSGVCHTQLNEIKGLKGEDPYLPHTLGHEGSGVVLEIGPQVTKVKPTDHVVLSWIKGKGKDPFGTVYQGKDRKVNSGSISTFMKYAVISENRLNPISKEISLEEAALLGCAFPTGAGAIFHQMKLQPGNSLAIFGVGGIGLSALIAAKQAQASTIIAIDVHEEKLEKAKQFGATHTLHAQSANFLDQLRELTQGKGVDFAFECAGKKGSMENAFASVKASGGLCVIAGNLPKGEKIEIDPFALISGKRIIGSWGGGSEIDSDIAFYSELLRKEKLALRELITHRVELNEINALFSDLDKGTVGRGLISFMNDPSFEMNKKWNQDVGYQFFR